MTELINKSDYNSLLDRVSTLTEEARRKAVKQVNTIIVHTYWEIGSLIVVEEQKGEERAEYGTALIVELSKDLTKRYGKGFSKSNLFLMRKFYLTYPPQKFQTVSGKFKNGEFLSWSHYCELITIKDDLARSFYEIESIKNNVLIDLKIGKLAHADVGQMNFYLNYIKDQEMPVDENPPVGILLCTEPNRSKVFVEYALGGLSNKVFVSKYKLYLPTKKELEAEIQKEATRLSLIKSEES